MDPQRFRQSTAGQVIRVGEGETAYWAFVPHPLPPHLLADWEVTAVLSEADRAISELAGLGRSIPNPHLLIGPFVRREAVLSSRIEGTQADLAICTPMRQDNCLCPAWKHRRRRTYARCLTM